MPSIRSIETALPEFSYSLEDIKQVGGEWLHDKTHERELFHRFLTSSKTNNRHFSIPASEVLNLGGLKSRSDIFERFAPRLGTESLVHALQNSKLSPEEIRMMVFTSCSCPSIPSVDALILEQAHLSRTTSRVPIFQHGCAGGVVGLSLGSKLCQAQGPVAVVAVELCSLVFQRENPTPAQLVGAAIFADGAASVILTPDEKGLVIRGTESYLMPQARHLMGYDLYDDGFHLRLDRELPQALGRAAPERVHDFLSHHNLSSKDIAHWLFHPGGVKILDFLESTFSLRPEQAHWSRDILSSVGNMSSATVLFVLKAFLDAKVSKPGDKIVMLGVGPGLTIELILFEWVG